MLDGGREQGGESIGQGMPKRAHKQHRREMVRKEDEMAWSPEAGREA